MNNMQTQSMKRCFRGGSHHFKLEAISRPTQKKKKGFQLVVLISVHSHLCALERRKDCFLPNSFSMRYYFSYDSVAGNWSMTSLARALSTTKNSQEVGVTSSIPPDQSKRTLQPRYVSDPRIIIRRPRIAGNQFVARSNSVIRFCNQNSFCAGEGVVQAVMT